MDHFFMPLLLLVFFSISTPAQSAGPWHNASDQRSLLAFKAAIPFDPNHFLASWSTDISFCNWTGVTCSRHMQRVVGLNVYHMGLGGVVSPLVGNLSALRSLDLSDNRLQGGIPPELSLLAELEVLYLYDNSLTGTIPRSLGYLFALIDLELPINNLTGPIPHEIGMLAKLQFLYLNINQFSGTIPSSIGNLSALTELALSTNNLIGPIPWEFGAKLSNLKVLYLLENHLSGNIPNSLGNLSALTVLTLSTNNLTGPIPVEIGRLGKLNTLHSYENLLTGPIPTSLLNCTALVNVFLDTNQLNGHIPWELGSKLANLQSLYLWGNQLTGNIPNSLGNCSKLKILYLNKNQLSGIVPMELGKLPLLERIGFSSNQLITGNSSSLDFLTALTNCSHLEWIDLYHNNLTGFLPSSIGHFSSKLFMLKLSHNKISGNIPQEITKLSNLAFLGLNNNLLSGHIPSRIKSLHKLERLLLSENNLEGNIPNEMGELQRLGLLDVSWNNLSGRIPGTLGKLQQLRRLYLHHNSFSGAIPVGLKRCQNLELLDFSHNDLKGNIPGEVLKSLKSLQFYLNLSRNYLEGPLPTEISKIVSVQAIDISGNQLDGEVPGVLGNCLALEHLNLSQNAFTGPIPDALSKLQNLLDMDLSSNFLSGAIPLSLRRLKVLLYINLCFNNLTGPIPEEGLFSNSTITQLFMGNPGLCGPKRYLLPACPKLHGHGKHSPHPKIILSVVGVSAFLLCSLVLGILWRQKFSRQQFHLLNVMLERLWYPKFSYQDLAVATNGFNETNLLGEGNFGSVYKGILRDGREIAIKVLNLQNEEAEKSFMTECKVLGRIRHRNLIRVISACSYPGFKGLVLQFASSGSLERHLYPHSNEEDVCQLGLDECLNIAIDVAHGIEYLHHDCSVQVLHCDLKPSNVLLDVDMTALVTDFGISRLATSTNSMDSLSTTFSVRGSIGYMAPEYGLGGRVSTKGDVYSYGIMLLEMVTRKKPTDAMFVGDLNLQNWVRSAFPNRLVDIVDNRMLRSVYLEQNRCLLSFIHVALLCTKESPQERPTMRDVGRGLETLRTTFMGSTAASKLTATISDLVRSAIAEGGSDSQSSSY